MDPKARLQYALNVFSTTAGVQMTKRFELLEEHGPAHERMYVVGCFVNEVPPWLLAICRSGPLVKSIEKPSYIFRPSRWGADHTRPRGRNRTSLRPRSWDSLLRRPTIPFGLGARIRWFGGHLIPLVGMPAGAGGHSARSLHHRRADGGRTARARGAASDHR
eukprot:scaffold6737_cov101-Isochrysis_galbana.AAC.2